MKYTNAVLIEKYNFKKGVIIQFKDILNKRNLIGRYTPLTNEHVEILRESVKIKDDECLTWEMAMNKAIDNCYGKQIQEESKEEKNHLESILSGQIKSVLSLNENGTLNDKQTLSVIKEIINIE